MKASQVEAGGVLCDLTPVRENQGAERANKIVLVLDHDGQPLWRAKPLVDEAAQRREDRKEDGEHRRQAYSRTAATSIAAVTTGFHKAQLRPRTCRHGKKVFQSPMRQHRFLTAIEIGA